jgi:glycosyltransferase involved in cell wall biosynthesis
MTPPPNVVFTIPRWEVSGVTTVNLDLAAALRDLGARCQLVVQDDNREACPYDLPAGIPCHSLLGGFRWWSLIPSNTLQHRLRARFAQHKLRRILNASGRVALIPGYAHGLASPRKPWGDNVGVFGVVHADDQTNMGFAVRHGREWVRCIGVSGRVAERVRVVAPWLEPILCVVQNGVPCSSSPPPAKSRRADAPLRVGYAGRLAQKQKRILDLAGLVELAAERRVPIQWEIAGEGAEEAILHERLSAHIAAGTVHWHGALKRSAVRELFRQSDVMILLSDFEGMPMSLLEAMAEGCVPVVSTGCDAGADLVRAKDAGSVVPTGDLNQCLAVLKALRELPERNTALSHAAWLAISEGPHNAAAMGAAYRELIVDWLGDHSCPDPW